MIRIWVPEVSAVSRSVVYKYWSADVSQTHSQVLRDRCVEHRHAGDHIKHSSTLLHFGLCGLRLTAVFQALTRLNLRKQMESDSRLRCRPHRENHSNYSWCYSKINKSYSVFHLFFRKNMQTHIDQHKHIFWIRFIFPLENCYFLFWSINLTYLERFRPKASAIIYTIYYIYTKWIKFNKKIYN